MALALWSPRDGGSRRAGQKIAVTARTRPRWTGWTG